MKTISLLILFLLFSSNLFSQHEKIFARIDSDQSANFFRTILSLRIDETIKMADAMDRFKIDINDAKILHFPSDRNRKHYSWKLDEKTIVILEFSIETGLLLGASAYLKVEHLRGSDLSDRYIPSSLFWSFDRGPNLQFEVHPVEAVNEEEIFPNAQ
jgi:hypothetical protein